MAELLGIANNFGELSQRNVIQVFDFAPYLGCYDALGQLLDKQIFKFRYANACDSLLHHLIDSFPIKVNFGIDYDFLL